MADVTLLKIVVTNISYDLDVEDAKEFSLEVKNEISLKMPKNPDDNSFLLVFETSIIEPQNNYINIMIKANAFFECEEKLSSYDDVIKDKCFPIVFKKIGDKIDQILEILDYPKLNISIDAFMKN